MCPVLAKAVVTRGLLAKSGSRGVPLWPGTEQQLTFTVGHVGEPAEERADPWHHLVVLVQDLHAVHGEELVLLRQAVQQQHRVPQTPHCPALLGGPWSSPCSP